MTRIEEDETARDALLDDWNERGLGGRVVRSHRRPRTPLRYRATSALALALAVVGVALGAAGTQQDQRESATWSAPALDAGVAVLVEEQPVATDPAPRRTAPDARASRSQRRAAPATWTGPTRTTYATSCYGTRDGRAHRGVDLDGETGDAVRAVGAGTVVQAGYRYSNAGLTVVVRHGDALSLYAHLSRAVVRVGQRVAAGTRLGSVGATGNATGSHLHLGIARTTALARLWSTLVDPVPWLQARGVVVAGVCG